MSEQLNATCAICGKKYHMCSTCKDVISYKPWRTIADSTDCYKIYMIIHQYNYGLISKDEAKIMLENCKMPNTFQEHIKKIIYEIMKEPNKKMKKGISNDK